MTVIGIGGLKRSGKDAAANALVEQHGYIKRGMSDVLDEFLILQNPLIQIVGRDVIPGILKVSPFQNFPFYLRYAVVRDSLSYEEAKEIADVRRLLQRTGTDAGRAVIGEDVWTTGAKASAGQHINEALEAKQNIVITGIRYPNELEMIHNVGGIAVYVNRPEITAAQAANPDTHTSENSLSADDFDVVLVNDGSLEDLSRSINELHESQVIHNRKRFPATQPWTTADAAQTVDDIKQWKGSIKDELPARGSVTMQPHEEAALRRAIDQAAQERPL